MARWGRAARRLHLPPGSKVLDLGCAFGFGTRLLLPRYRAYGHDLSGSYIERARRAVPAAVFTQGPANDVPYPDDFFDAVLLLDVLEHVPDERALIDEVARVLRPGGQLVVSVPNRGLLAKLDSLNLYQSLMGSRALPPTDDPSWPVSPVHRHYAVRDLAALLGHRFQIRSIEYTGLGLAEVLHLPLLLLLRGMFHLPSVYERLQYLYFGVYLAEDLVRTGSFGYHLMIAAERTGISGGCHCSEDTA